jgi:cell shape-determining protein MreD
MFAAFWLIQDLVAVTSSDVLLAPAFFIFYVIYHLLSRSEENSVSHIWIAFAGGLLWDFRHVGTPGFFAFFYVLSLLIASWIWRVLPNSGRTVPIFILILWGTQLPSVTANLMLWGVHGETFVEILLVQLGYALPIAAVFALFYAKRMN